MKPRDTEKNLFRQFSSVGPAPNFLTIKMENPYPTLVRNVVENIQSHPIYGSLIGKRQTGSLPLEQVLCSNHGLPC